MSIGEKPLGLRLRSRWRIWLARLGDCRSTPWLRVVVCRPGVKHNLEAKLKVRDAAISLPCSCQLSTLPKSLVRNDISEEANDLSVHLHSRFTRLGHKKKNG